MVETTWRRPAAAATAIVLRGRQPWARPTTTKQSQWLGIMVWRSATVNVETRATESLSIRRGGF
jgi:hypothetical protein